MEDSCKYAKKTKIMGTRGLEISELIIIFIDSD